MHLECHFVLFDLGIVITVSVGREVIVLIGNYVDDWNGFERCLHGVSNQRWLKAFHSLVALLETEFYSGIETPIV